jgi:hypothetical protein
LRNACRISTARHTRRRELGRPRRRYEVSIAIRRIKSGIGEPEETLIVEQQLGKEFSSTTSNNGSIVGKCVLYWARPEAT